MTVMEALGVSCIPCLRYTDTKGLNSLRSFADLSEIVRTLYPLTTAQRSIWLAQVLDRENPGYNLGECVEIIGELIRVAFERAVQQAILETDSLHLRFVETNEGPQQYFSDDRRGTLRYLDFTDVPDPDDAAESWVRK